MRLPVKTQVFENEIILYPASLVIFFIRNLLSPLFIEKKSFKKLIVMYNQG